MTKIESAKQEAQARDFDIRARRCNMMGDGAGYRRNQAQANAIRARHLPPLEYLKAVYAPYLDVPYTHPAMKLMPKRRSFI
jgi:hypothetical protein